MARRQHADVIAHGWKIQPDFAETYNALIERSRPSLVSAPPVCAVFAALNACNVMYYRHMVSPTIRSHQHGPEYEDDSPSSHEADGQVGGALEDDDETAPKLPTQDDSNDFTPRSLSTLSPTIASLPPLPTRHPALIRSCPQPRAYQVSRPRPREGREFLGCGRGRRGGAFKLEADNDIVGIVVLEIQSATDHPRLRNSELLELPASQLKHI
jgi:phosphatidylserine decarboxylase